MNQIKAKIGLFFKKLRGHFLEPIPLGLSALTEFSNDTLRIYSVPDHSSYHHAIASMIMHLPEDQTKISKAYIARRLKKAMANQIAWAVIEKIRNDEKVKDSEAATSAITAAASAPIEGVATDVIPKPVPI